MKEYSNSGISNKQKKQTAIGKKRIVRWKCTPIDCTHVPIIHDLSAQLGCCYFMRVR